MRRFLKLLPSLLALIFALQVGAVVPLHHFHGAETSSGKPSLPDGCRCDLCVSLSSLDPSSAAAAPLIALRETVFAILPAIATRDIPAPIAPWSARGPPSRAA